MVASVLVGETMTDDREDNMNRNDKKHNGLVALAMAGVLVASGPVHADGMGETLDQRFSNHEIKVNDRLGRFREELQITAAQQTAWDAYLGAIRRNMEDTHEQVVRENQHPPATAPEHFQRMMAMKQEQMADFKRVADTFDTLYATLTPAQKQVADEHFARMRAKMMKRAQGQQ